MNDDLEAKITHDFWTNHTGFASCPYSHMQSDTDDTPLVVVGDWDWLPRWVRPLIFTQEIVL